MERQAHSQRADSFQHCFARLVVLEFQFQDFRRTWWCGNGSHEALLVLFKHRHPPNPVPSGTPLLPIRGRRGNDLSCLRLVGRFHVPSLVIRNWGRAPLQIFRSRPPPDRPSERGARSPIALPRAASRASDFRRETPRAKLRIAAAPCNRSAARRSGRPTRRADRQQNEVSKETSWKSGRLRIFIKLTDGHSRRLMFYINLTVTCQ